MKAAIIIIGLLVVSSLIGCSGRQAEYEQELGAGEAAPELEETEDTAVSQIEEAYVEDEELDVGEII